MQNFLNVSNVVDSVRSNAGSAFKSVQRNFEEQALKAAGLGEDEEALYRLNKRTQAYLRAADAMQQAASALADDFADAIEDLAMREIARKFRDTSKTASAQQLASLNKEVAEPVRQACDGDNYTTRQRLISKAFSGLLDVNLECFRVTSSLVEPVHNALQAALEQSRPRAKTEPASRKPSTPAPAPQVRPTSDADAIHRRASAPNVNAAADSPINRRASAPAASFEDLLGGMSTEVHTGSTAKQTHQGDLLDFDFGFAAAAPTSKSPIGGTGTSLPPERAAASSVPLDLNFDFNAPSASGSFNAPSASTPLASFPASGGYQSQSPASQTPISGGSSLSGLSDMYWPSKEDEDESCIKARVVEWTKGKNLRTMLVSLHEVVPASAGWVPVQLGEVVEASDVKSVYRKAVLAVHPDKHQTGKAGEKILGHLVFEALRDEWNVFRSSG